MISKTRNNYTVEKQPPFDYATIALVFWAGCVTVEDAGVTTALLTLGAGSTFFFNCNDLTDLAKLFVEEGG